MHTSALRRCARAKNAFRARTRPARALFIGCAPSRHPAWDTPAPRFGAHRAPDASDTPRLVRTHQGLRSRLCKARCTPAQKPWGAQGTAIVAKGSEIVGAARGIRTPDPLITNEVLYQLSYCGPARAGCVGAIVVPARFSYQIASTWQARGGALARSGPAPAASSTRGSGSMTGGLDRKRGPSDAVSCRCRRLFSSSGAPSCSAGVVHTNASSFPVTGETGAQCSETTPSATQAGSARRSRRPLQPFEQSAGLAVLRILDLGP